MVPFVSWPAGGSARTLGGLLRLFVLGELVALEVLAAASFCWASSSWVFKLHLGVGYGIQQTFVKFAFYYEDNLFINNKHRVDITEGDENEIWRTLVRVEFHYQQHFTSLTQMP